jgi:hypothetical protein
LAERLSHFRESDDFKEDVIQKDLEARQRLSVLEERMRGHDRELSVLRTTLFRHSRAQESTSEALLGRIARLEAEVSVLVLVPASAVSDSTVPRSPPLVPLATPPSASVPQSFVPTAPVSATFGPPSVWHSAIVPDFPKLFEDFKKKKFTLLWRGGRDGFGADDFHERCDRHANTLTVILDTDGNIFGGFTPVEWESRKWNGKTKKENNCWKADPSVKSFLFTLKNPHNIPARKCTLKAGQKNWAIMCRSDWGPRLSEIAVSGNSNANTNSWTHLGSTYNNDAGMDGKTFFTGSENFQVKEIEVFEITK